jgi:DNA-binding MarR family transcriptional regulator
MMTPRTEAGAVLESIVLAVFRLNGDFLRAAEMIAAPAGLTAARWQVLGAIIHRPATVADIARAMGLARQSVQRLADILAGEGLAEYIENPAHKRAKLLSMTEAGRAAIDRLADRAHRWGNAASAGLPVDALSACLSMLKLLSERAEATLDETLLS